MEIKEQIIESICNSLNSNNGDRKTYVVKEEIQIGIPENSEFGDYSTNIAMQAWETVQGNIAGIKLHKHASNISGKNPREMAENIRGLLLSDIYLAEIVDRIEVAGPGFINFYLKNDLLVKNLSIILDDPDKYGSSNLLKGKRINLEFGQPNTHKMPHIGHLFSYVLGSTLSNILEFKGAVLHRVNYQGDIGPHVAKCLWGFEKEKPQIPERLEEKVQLLQKMYQKGSGAYDTDDQAKAEITEINKKIYSQDSQAMDFYYTTRGWSVDYYKEFEKRLGIKYDRYYFETEVQEKGKKNVVNNVGKVFTESQGALIFEGSKYGLHDRVFVTSKGTPTYEAKDTYLEELKYKEWPYDLLIITTANEQNDYFKVVYKAIELLNPELIGKLKHIGFGMVNLKVGKMSSRSGMIVGGVELVDTVVSEIKKIVSDRKDLDQTEKDKISEVVGIGAVKYSFLKSNPLQNITFDLKESISLEGNAGPYIQYTYARTQSVLKKAAEVPADIKMTGLNKDEEKIMRQLVHFPQVIEDAALNYSPNIICNYLYKLAQGYNSFYNGNKIIGGENEGVRLALTSAVGTVIKNGLDLLGIQAPERM